MKCALIVPTRNAGRMWPDWLLRLKNQTLQPDRILVIDSSSSDETVSLALEAGLAVDIITPAEFNHGGTRNKIASRCGEADILIFLTQDALLVDPQSLSSLVACFEDPRVAAVCGRQLPHDDANPLAVHARMFNYPVKTEYKSALDIPRLGIKTAFMSNSFSAYRNNVFRELGTFPNNTILAEDMYLTAKMIQAGYKVVYCADATVKHSHNYTPWEEFRRYFDTGVFHACEPWIRAQFGGAGGEGMKFIRSELAYLKNHAPLWIPRALFTNVCKLLGYKLGQQYSKLPFWLCKQFSMYKSYWLQNNIR